MSGFLAGWGTTDQGSAHCGIDTTVISGNDRSAIPVGATLVTANSGNVGAATATATLTAPGVGKTNYCTSVELDFQGATAPSVVAAVVSGGSGLVGGARCFPVVVPTGATVVGQSIIVQFSPPLQAGASNATITFVVGSLGTGNTTTLATINGYSTPF